MSTNDLEYLKSLATFRYQAKKIRWEYLNNKKYQNLLVGVLLNTYTCILLYNTSLTSNKLCNMYMLRTIVNQRFLQNAQRDL